MEATRNDKGRTGGPGSVKKANGLPNAGQRSRTGVLPVEAWLRLSLARGGVHVASVTEAPKGKQDGAI